MRDRSMDKFACNAVPFTILTDTLPRMIIKRKKITKTIKNEKLYCIFTVDIVPNGTVRKCNNFLVKEKDESLSSEYEIPRQQLL